MAAGLEHYEKYGLGGDTINELNQRALKAHKPMMPSLSIHPNCRCTLIPIGDGNSEILESSNLRLAAMTPKPHPQRLWIHGTGGNDLRAYDFEGITVKEAADRMAKVVDALPKMADYVEGWKFMNKPQIALLRKTCGNTQKSRWACRGCQYVGECK